MLPRSPKEGASAVLSLSLIVITGCTIEVNINTHDHEEASDLVTGAPEAAVDGAVRDALFRYGVADGPER